MKLLTYPVLIIAFMLVVSSCDDNLINPKPNPLSIYTPQNVYNTPDGLEGLLVSLRKSLRNDFEGRGGTSITVELFSSDIGVAGEQRGELVMDHDNASTPTIVGTNREYPNWRRSWDPIRDANVLITRIDEAEWDSETRRNRVLAEGYFHRAYQYYKLVHQFGDVPFLNTEITSPRVDLYTHSRKTILKKIQDDLEFAVQWLPEDILPGQISRAAGYHLLTKVYLANSQFDDAIKAASSIINDGRYQLMTERFGIVAGDDRFNVIWDLHEKGNRSINENTEAILVVLDDYSIVQGRTTEGLNTMRLYTPWWSHASYLKDPDGLRAGVDTSWDPQLLAYGRGVGIFRTGDYYNFNIWENAGSDLRVDPDTNWVSREKILINNPNSNYFGQPVDFSHSNPGDSVRAWYPWPQYKTYIEDENRPQQPWGGNSDWYVFRLAETYLLRAEAYFWKGDRANAATDINKVRERADAPSATVSEIDLNYILDERARELYLEEFRKSELTRIALIMAENGFEGYSIENFHEKNYWYDRIIEKNTFYNRGIVWQGFEYKISPYHVFWPIPQSTIDANTRGRINQNSGYPGAENNEPPRTEID